MHEPDDRIWDSRPRRRKPWSLLAVACIGGAIWLGATHLADPAPPPQPESAQSLQGSATRDLPRAEPLPKSPPTRVRIPQIRVDAPLMGLDLEQGGKLRAPPEHERNLAGWYTAGPAPGSQGTSVIAGHVDIPEGRGVFYDLGALKKGMAIDVDRQDGHTAQFTVYAIEVHDAEYFPDTKVYGPTGRPELRLITCGGGFDKTRDRYRGNVIVYASLTHRADSTPAPSTR